MLSEQKARDGDLEFRGDIERVRAGSKNVLLDKAVPRGAEIARRYRHRHPARD